jgi:hypothetical protein
MKLRFLVPVLAFAFLTIGARAQVGLYFNPIVTVIHSSVPDTSSFAFLGTGETQQVFGGVMFGGYYTVYHAPKLNVSFDLRDEIEHGNNASLNSFLFGARFAYKPANSAFRPYVQIDYGAGRTKAPTSSVHVTKGEFAAFVGADRALTKHIDWRVVEVGYGAVTAIGSAVYANTNQTTPVPAASLFNFSTGFVFRF